MVVSNVFNEVPSSRRPGFWLLRLQQTLKMARSAHAYVRGSTVKFYEWLEAAETRDACLKVRPFGSAGIVMLAIWGRSRRWTDESPFRSEIWIRP